jgi:hypothetical protein
MTEESTSLKVPSTHSVAAGLETWLQSPSPEQTSSYCTDLWRYVVDRCPGALVEELDMVEWSVLLERMMEEQHGPVGV